jgi:hypothetical protein
MVFLAALVAKPVRNTYKRLHPVSIQVRLLEALPGNTERFMPQYYIYRNMQTMMFLN